MKMPMTGVMAVRWRVMAHLMIAREFKQKTRFVVLTLFSHPFQLWFKNQIKSSRRLLPGEEFETSVPGFGEIGAVDNLGETRSHGRLAHVSRGDADGQIAVTPQLV